MRKALPLTIAGTALLLAAGTAVAHAKDGEDDDDRDDRRAVIIAPGAARPSFELEIDPELDAQFGPRRVDAARAAAIVEGAVPGARVLEAELDERDGGPIWEIEFALGGREREVDVDADNGAILGSDD